MTENLNDLAAKVDPADMLAMFAGAALWKEELAMIKAHPEDSKALGMTAENEQDIQTGFILGVVRTTAAIRREKARQAAGEGAASTALFGND